jgi:ATP adenylyltransferase
LHVVPRWNGDTNFMTTLAETRVIPEDFNTTLAKLKPLF